MAQIQFFYLGKDYRSTKIKGDTFKAYKYRDKETKETTLYPIITSEYEPNPKEIFIYGVGYKKIGKSVIEVPVFDGNSEHWDNYIKQYGVYCLYYSIDGTDYLTNDCCAIRKQTEFRSILYYGIENFVDFINHFIKMTDIQFSVIKEKYAPLIKNGFGCDNMDETIKEKYIFNPSYFLFYTYVVNQYSPDILNDDKRMERLYRDYRESELKSKSEDYQKALSIEKKKFELYKELKEKYGQSFGYVLNDDKVNEYHKLDSECSVLFDKAYSAIREQINTEVNTDNDAFPTSVEDRIKYLFGDEVAKIYDYLVETYLTKDE